MKRVKQIKPTRQEHIKNKRQKRDTAIEKEKDVQEVSRDKALIRSPAVGLRYRDLIELDEDASFSSSMTPSKVTAVDITKITVDASSNTTAIYSKGFTKKGERKLVVEVVESDLEMDAN